MNIMNIIILNRLGITKQIKLPKKAYKNILSKEEFVSIIMRSKDIQKRSKKKILKNLEKNYRKIVENVKEDIKYIEKNDIKVVHPYNNYYPIYLKLIRDKPLILYVKGSTDILRNNKMIAVSGKRECSKEGIKNTENLVKRFIEEGWVIVSGLAKGIDTVAHKTALECGGKTVAVLGNGLRTIYPKENKKLAERIIENGGCIISEVPLDEKPLPKNLVRRNRIITGMCVGVFIGDIGEKGGTWHAIKFALKQGRLIAFNKRIKTIIEEKIRNKDMLICVDEVDVLEVFEKFKKKLYENMW